MEVIGIVLYTDMCGWVPDKWFYTTNADCFGNRNSSLERHNYSQTAPNK
jgi:hypothetical protein